MTHGWLGAGYRALRVLALVATTITGSAQASDDLMLRYGLGDIRVLYVYSNVRDIDWPTLYYLNDEFGCRVDLLTLQPRTLAGLTHFEMPDRQWFRHVAAFDPEQSAAIDSLIDEQFSIRLPDIVIYNTAGDTTYNRVKDRIDLLAGTSAGLFTVAKEYTLATVSGRPSRDIAVINQRELFHRYADRMKLELPRFFPSVVVDAIPAERFVHYQLVRNRLTGTTTGDNLMAGLEQIRLLAAIDSVFDDGPMKVTFDRQAQKYLSSLNAARRTQGRNRVDFIIDGYRELRNLSKHERVLADLPYYQAYLDELLRRAELLTLDAVGIGWEGRIILRDSPHGTRLKFRASVSVEGPRPITIGAVYFHPYWDSLPQPLERGNIEVAPHQTIEREYFIDIDPDYLDSEKPDSLRFTVELSYGEVPLVFSSTLPVSLTPDLQVRFEPDYYFVAPFDQLDIDRVVSSMNWKIMIEKPAAFAGTVELNLETPVGLFAGAYRKEIELDKGELLETIRIPFTISNLFELGIQQQTIQLLVDDKLVTADSGRIRIAACEIDEKTDIGFMPDSTGALEDVLRLSNTSYRPLTDRTLVAGDLEAYDVIIMGSGSHRSFPSLAYARDRLQSFVNDGGSLVILGQPEDFPANLLPVSLAPSIEMVLGSEIQTQIAQARILSQPYVISEKNLLSSFYRRTQVSAAVVKPAERVLVTPGGASLLCISRIGDGQIIFCGLPLLELIGRLDIDAIHLFANLMNY